jgi:hypothetical protein
MSSSCSKIATFALKTPEPIPENITDDTWKYFKVNGLFSFFFSNYKYNLGV